MWKMGARIIFYIKILYDNFMGLFLLFSVPLVYSFQCGVMKSVLTREFRASFSTKIFYYFLSTFLFTNVFGNLLMFIMTDSSLKDSVKEDGSTYCSRCKIHRPADCLHCTRCRACVLGKDHHCLSFSMCVGLKNQRYFILGLAYSNISCLYNFCFNYYYAVHMLRHLPDLSALYMRFLATFSHYLPSWFFSEQVVHWLVILGDLRTILCILNAAAAFWVFYIAQHHVLKIARGTSAIERSMNLPLSFSRTRKNIVKIFGKRWYFAIFWPFVVSPFSVVY